MINKCMPSIKELKEEYTGKRIRSGMDRLITNLAVYITKGFLYTPIRPMQVMFLWFLIQILSLIIILKKDYWFILIGVFIYQAITILDHVDGQLARCYGQKSILALYIDQFYHNIANPLFIMCLAIASGNLLIGVAIITIFFYNRLIIFNSSVYNLKENDVKRTLKRIVEPNLNKLFFSRKQEKETIMTRIYELFRIERPFNVIFFGALLGLLKWTLMLYLILFMVDFVRRLYSQVKSLLEVDKILYK